jgi:hypothetical protein
MNNSDELQAIWEGYDGSIKKNNPTYSGLLGLTIDGEQQVEHPTRNGFVYFRFRDNLSEVVSAFNDKVSPVYNLPVVVERVRNNWRVIGRDTDRYSNWGSSAPYLPKHGFQHSFDRDAGTGGDVVLIYPDQFIPLLVYPSGTFGAGNLQVGPHLLQRDSDFIYVGNTGTSNLLPYKPTDSFAIMGLVYLDRNTGNPGFLINSGSSFNGAITGTAEVSPYIPYPASNQEPLYAFRLVSGTTSLRWENLYNARQFIGGGQGGSSLVSGTYMDLTTNQVAAGIKRFSDSIQIGIEPPAAESDGGISQASEGASVANFLWTWGAGFASFITGLFARGTKALPTAALKDDVLFRWRARAHDNSTYGNTSVEIRGVADEDHNTSGHGTRLEIYTTPTGTTTLTKVLTLLSGGSLNIEAGKSYLVNNVPVSGGGSDKYPMEARLTLETGVAVPTTDQLAKTTLYLTQRFGDQVAVFDSGGTPSNLTLSADASISLAGLGRSQAYTNDPAAGSNVVLNMANTAGFRVNDRVKVSSSAGSEEATITVVVANTSITVDSLALNHTTTNPLVTNRLPYDVYVYDNSSAVGLELLAWTDMLTRATAYTLQDGIPVKSGDITRRLVGTIVTTLTLGQCEDSTKECSIANLYNPTLKELRCSDSTDSWNYTTATMRPANASQVVGTGRVYFAVCIEGMVTLKVDNFNQTQNTLTNKYATGGIGIDSISTSSAQFYGIVMGTANAYFPNPSTYRNKIAAGGHYVQRLESSEAAGVTKWAGDVNAPGLVLVGMQVEYEE